MVLNGSPSERISTFNIEALSYTICDFTKLRALDCISTLYSRVKLRSL